MSRVRQIYWRNLRVQGEQESKRNWQRLVYKQAKENCARRSSFRQNGDRRVGSTRQRFVIECVRIPNQFANLFKGVMPETRLFSSSLNICSGWKTFRDAVSFHDDGCPLGGLGMSLLPTRCGLPLGSTLILVICTQLITNSCVSVS